MVQNEAIVGIGGAAGDGVASAGNALALSAARQGLAVYAYNSYQSVIRGGHSWLRMRLSANKPLNHGDQVDALIALNQDTLDRHLRELTAGAVALYNDDKVKPSYEPPEGVQLCPLPVPQLCAQYKQLSVMQNTVAIGAVSRLLGLDLAGLESVLGTIFAQKPSAVAVNVEAAKAGYQHAAQHFGPRAKQLGTTTQKWALVTGNELFALGAALAGCQFYCAYPMSPATHILEWFAAHGRQLGICVRQVEDEISVINMTIGASHMGVRSMCATSGGGFALMTEAIGMAGMIETPVVVINVMRAGPSTGVPTKTEQADLNQAVGASQGDFPRVILAPRSIADCFATMPLAFNVADHYQCPVIVLADMLMGEGNETVEASLLDGEFDIDRGELITRVPAGLASAGPYLRYKNTPSGVSPRAIPGLAGCLYVAASDEHDEDGVLVSDVYTDTARRKKMVDKRARKMNTLLDYLPKPELAGPAQAEVTLVGWGSTWGAITEALERLNRQGVDTNHLHFKSLVPLHVETAGQVLGRSKRIVVVENNHSGQFARHLRAETGISAHAHIRKYDGEPFEPKHIVAGVEKILAGQEVVEVLSTEPGWQTPHPGPDASGEGRIVAPAAHAGTRQH